MYYNRTILIWEALNGSKTFQADALLASPTLTLDAIDLQLYRGDLLADFYDEWILSARERYRLLHQEVLLRLTQIARAQSENARAIEYAQMILRHDAANERAHQHVMFAQLASGNRAAALQQYEECVRAPFQATAQGVVGISATAKYQPGKTVWVKYDPSDSSKVILDHS